jgi:hypothetical protein
MKLQVLTGRVSTTAIWSMAQCSLVEVGRRFRGAYCLHHQGEELQAVSTFETPVCCYEATRLHLPEGYYFRVKTCFTFSLHSFLTDVRVGC